MNSKMIHTFLSMSLLLSCTYTFSGNNYALEQKELLQEVLLLKQTILNRAFNQLANLTSANNDTQIADAIEQFVTAQKTKSVIPSTGAGPDQQYKDSQGVLYDFLVHRMTDDEIFEVLGARYNKAKRGIAQKYDRDGIRFETNQDIAINPDTITTVYFSNDDAQKFNKLRVTFDDISSLIDLMLEDIADESKSIQEFARNQLAPLTNSDPSHCVRLKFVWLDKYTLAMFYSVEQRDSKGELKKHFIESKAITSRPDNNQQLTEDERKLILINELLALMYN